MIKKIFGLSILSLLTGVSFAQIGINQLNGGNNDDDVSNLRINTITTAVPFLLISPDSRASGMGDVGVATSPDAASTHWNAAKLAYAEKEMGFSIAYTPWLRNLVNDINLSYVSFYKKIDRRQTFGASLRYFSLGNIQFTDEFGQNIQAFNPNEFALDGVYGIKLSDKISGGVSFRYIYSNLTGGINVQGSSTKAGQSAAFDISGYYESDEVNIGGRDVMFAAGAVISNIGAKMAYSNTSKKDFIPINLRLGPRATIKFDDYNELSFTIEANKLLVPTPPIYLIDDQGQPVLDGSGNYTIGAGKSPNRAMASGIFGSFSDAPGQVVRDNNGDPVLNTDGTYQIENGSVLVEELREISIATGLEYWYDKQFAVRAGYFNEHITKGNRKYFTMGVGLKYNVIGLDFSYLVPAYTGNNTLVQTSPLQNTLRVTLVFDFEAFKAQSGES